MLLPAFALVLAGAALLTVWFVARRRARLERERRARLIAGAKSVRAKKIDAFGGLLKAKTNPFDARVRSLFTIGLPRTWAMRSGSLKLLLAGSVAAGVIWNVALGLFSFPPLFCAVGGVAAFFVVPRFLLSREQKKTERKFEEIFPDAVDTMGRLVRAGLSITAAVRTVAVETPPPVSTVFAAIGDQLKIGVPIDEILNDSSATVGQSDFRFFAMTVALQHETGGNLTQAMQNLSELMRRRRGARLKANAATGEIRMTAYVLASVPVLTIGALLVIQPGYLQPLIADPRGHVILTLAACCMVAAFLSMRALMARLTTN